MKRYGTTAWILILVVALCGVVGAAENLLKNPGFEAGFSDAGVPEGWQKYGARKDPATANTARSDTAAEGRRGLLINDSDKVQEAGVSQRVNAEGNVTYRASVKCRKVGSPNGAYLQMRFLPSNKLKQAPLAAKSDQEFTEISVEEKSPEGTNRIMIYLYTHKGPTPKLIVDDVRLGKVGD